MLQHYSRSKRFAHFCSAIFNSGSNFWTAPNSIFAERLFLHNLENIGDISGFCNIFIFQKGGAVVHIILSKLRKIPENCRTSVIFPNINISRKNLKNTNTWKNWQTWQKREGSRAESWDRFSPCKGGWNKLLKRDPAGSLAVDVCISMSHLSSAGGTAKKQKETTLSAYSSQDANESRNLECPNR